MLHSPVIISCSSHQLIITSGGLHIHHLIITRTRRPDWCGAGRGQDWCGTGAAEKIEKISPRGLTDSRGIWYS